MRNRGPFLISAFATLVTLAGSAGGCPRAVPCAPAPVAATPDSTEAPFVGSGDPYQLGPLSVTLRAVARCEQGCPRPLLILSPRDAGTYAVVLFQHGFQSRNSWYTRMLEHVASHGFVVLAPQMYEPGLDAFRGDPTPTQEAQRVGELLDWLPGRLAGLIGVNVRLDRLGIAGHSRGGKVAWITLLAQPERIAAIAGVDPVDGRGGTRGEPSRVVQGPFSYAQPSLVLGAGLGGVCTPTGDNHVQFYAAAPSPAWHIVATEQGHADMLNPDRAREAAWVCASGDDLTGMRRLAGGALAAFFRASLQGDLSAYEWLSDRDVAPVPITTESK